MERDVLHGRELAGPDSHTPLESACRGRRIDVLIVVEPASARVPLENRIIDIAFDVNLAFGVYISPRVLTPGILNDPVWRETSFIKNVVREGIPV